MVRGRGKHSSAACSHLVLREVGGLRIGVAGGDLNGADRDPGVQSGRYEAVTEQVRGDVLGDTGPLGEAPDDPGGAVPVESVAGPGGIEAPSDHGRGSSTVSRPPTPPSLCLGTAEHQRAFYRSVKRDRITGGKHMSSRKSST
jgi:hypothetical protein